MKKIKGYKIYVNLKHMGNVAKKVKPYGFILKNKPDTLSDLVKEMVISCVLQYKECARNSKNPKPLSDEEYAAMQEIGKFAFGVHYNEKEIDEAKSIKTALDAVSDGIVRIFKNNEELTDINGKIEINEGDTFTLVRLTMLSGRMW